MHARAQIERNYSYRGVRAAPETLHAARHQAETSIVGSFLVRTLPRDLPSLLHKGILVDPRNGWPMEMDAYSAYLALKAIEKGTGEDLATERKILCDAILRRMGQCNGFWSHGAWTGSDREIHMRFTAAAIRLLLEAWEDGLVEDRTVIIGALKKHLAYCEALERGTWFLHDSLEQVSTGVPYPRRRSINQAFGSSTANNLALNTHLDTISTVINVLHRFPLLDAEQDYFSAAVVSGMAALEFVLDAPPPLSWRLFSPCDSAIRSFLFRSSGSRGGLAKLTNKICGLIYKAYFPLRQRIRSRLPFFLFSDGYIERDIALSGTSFEYHLVNVYDLARLLLQIEEADPSCDRAFLQKYETIIDRGLDYAARSAYRHFLLESARRNARPILLCEAILARLATMQGHVPPHWVSAYCAIRRQLPPSPAIQGYDPFIVTDARPLPGRDVVQLRGGKWIEIDLVEERLVSLN